MKKTARRLINRADKVMDAPYINNDYCEYTSLQCKCSLVVFITSLQNLALWFVHTS